MAPSSWITAGLTAAMLVAQALAQCQATPASRFPAQMASDYSSKLLTSGLRQPRGIAFDGAGNLLVVEQGGGGIRYVKLTEAADGSVCVQSSKQLIADTSLNHGIAVSPDDKTLFVSSLDNVFAYTYDAAAGTASNRKTIINQMRNGGFHPTRTLWVSRADPDVLLVQRGSQDNVDQQAAQESTGRSLIRYFSISQILNSPVAHATGGKLLGMGLRNTVAFGENIAKGEFWSVDNSVDDMRRQNRDVHNDNPAEELNFHGAVNASNPNLGGNFGYPSCVAAWALNTLGNTALKVGSQIATSVAAGASVQSADGGCGRFIPPRLVFPPHTAPLDIKFTRDGKYAFISFHGSWNRQPPDGYRVMRVEFGEDGQPLVASDSQDAGVTVMSNPSNAACPNRCFRPVGLALDPKGRLFMSSDSSGEIYIISGGIGLGR